MNWKPIVTSPRDGTPIIVAKFGKNETGQDCGFWWISKGHFDAERQCFHDGIERLSWPTHWMPVIHPMPEGIELLKEDDATKVRRYAISRLEALVEDILSEIDGGEELRGRDSQLSAWAADIENAVQILKQTF